MENSYVGVFLDFVGPSLDFSGCFLCSLHVYVCAQLQLGGDAGRDYTNCKKAQEPKKGKELKINENYKKAKKKEEKK